MTYQRAACQALLKLGLGEPEQSGKAPSRLFRGWQANPNSIFGEGVLLNWFQKKNA
jgi:hypothetical protein